MKKILSLAVCTALVANIAPLHIKANESGGDVQVSENGNRITIGNGYIKRVFENNNGKWKTVSIDNKRIDEQFKPAEGSEDFVINLVNGQKTEEQKPVVTPPTQALDRTTWQATLKNKDGVEFSHPEYLFDGDKNTYVDEYQKAGFPISLEIDLGSKQEVSSFSFLKRPGFSDQAYGFNGTLGKYKVYISDDQTNWNEVANGEFTKEDYNLHQEGNLYNVGDVVYANLNATYKTQYVKLEALSDALGSTEEFTGAEFNLYSDKTSAGIPQKEVSLAGSNVTFKGKSTDKLTDGNLNFAVSGNVNDEIVFDLGSVQTIGSFAYQKRPGFHDANYGLNGTMGKYELYVSDNGTDWTPAGKGEFVRDDYNLHSVVLSENTQTSDGKYNVGDTLHNVGDLVYGNFNSVYTTRFVKIVPKSDCMGGTNEFQATEIKLYSDQKFESKKDDTDTDIRSSELTVSENGITTKNNEVRVSFDTYEKDGVNWDIDMVTVMENDKYYMNSYLEITVDKPEEAKIDYIDFDNFVIPEGTSGVWSIPEENKISSMWIGKHELMLGQPIYADGLFFGSEFPAQDTDVNDQNAMQIRYYSGKSIAKMASDGQNVTNEGKTYRTWNNVVGAAQGTPTDVVQTDFFNYIEDIATPSDFRKQYNSWYDNMMNINDESIEKSFLGAEKGLAENGVEPLDSYVVDDGWNNYNNDIGGVNAPGESGTTKNQTGFWEFNSKFPNELYTSTELTDKFQSSFGVWVGPQGGYNFFGGFAKYLEAMGTAEMQSNSALGNVICTGSRTYLKNFEDRFIDYQTRFNIDYWKWDGFASRPCNNPNHNHMTGGDHDMYYTSDMWEAWTDVIEHARAARAQEGKGLWINATCYVNLSPWLLQWVNTVWVQDSGDTGEAGASGERHQRKIYYRDNVYYNLYKKNQIQFPLKNIYNHDPIYGVSDASKATTEVFREYLLDNAMRGTAFWELYYSPSLFDEEKWEVTADVLDFAETNHNVLKNAKLFVQEGKNPSNGVYGYSAWNNKKGFVSFVNPTATKQTYELTLDNIVGVPTSMKGLKEYSIYPYAAGTTGKTVSYGDTLKVTLEPNSSVIYQYGNTDSKAPEFVSAKITKKDAVEVRFNERVSDDIKFKVNGKSAEAVLQDDYRTFEVKASDLSDAANLSISGIKDVYGNEASAVEVESRTAKEIAKVASKEDVKGDVSESKSDSKTLLNLKNKAYTITENGIKGDDDFSVSMTVDTKSSNTVLLKQDDDFQLSIDADGYVVFNVKGQQVTSKENVTTVVEHASGKFNTNEYKESVTQTTTIGKVNDGKLHVVHAVREPNGMLKLYVDGRLATSAYDKKNHGADLSGAPVVLGSTKFTGFVGDVVVRNSALYYDDAQKAADHLGINATSKKLSKKGWDAEACSQQTDEVGTGGDGSAKDVLDNKLNTYWHSNYSGQDHCGGTHTLTVSFGKEITFDSLEYVARQGAGNGTWTSATVYGIDKSGNETKIAEVSDMKLTNNKYEFAFDQSQTFKVVRFEVQGSGGFASAAEINATVKVQQQDTEKVLDLQNKAQELLNSVNSEDYTKDSYKKFVKAVDAIMDMSAFTSEEEVAALDAKLRDAYNNLKAESPSTVNKDALTQALQKYAGYKEAEYTAESWKAFAQAYAGAREVKDDANATQEAVDAAVEKLNAAANNLVKAENPSTVNKEALTQALQKYAEYKEAEYTAESWKAFAQAYAGAREVNDNANATQEAVDAAVEKLNVAAKKLVKAEKPVDPEKPGKPENPDKPNKPETAEKPSKPGKPAKPGKVTTGLQTNTGILMVAGTLAIAGFGVLVALARRKRY